MFFTFPDFMGVLDKYLDRLSLTTFGSFSFKKCDVKIRKLDKILHVFWFPQKSKFFRISIFLKNTVYKITVVNLRL